MKRFVRDEKIIAISNPCIDVLSPDSPGLMMRYTHEVTEFIQKYDKKCFDVWLEKWFRSIVRSIWLECTAPRNIDKDINASQETII